MTAREACGSTGAAIKGSDDGPKERRMSGVGSLLWLLSAVSEVKTSRGEQRGKKKRDSWPACGTHCFTAAFNKRHSSIDPSGGSFSKHPAELKVRRDPCVGLTKGFLFKCLMRNCRKIELSGLPPWTLACK